MEDIRFVYDEPAAIISAGNANVLVMGDLHVGMERRLLGKGIRIYNTTELMAKRITAIAERFNAKRIFIIGDIKDSLLRPDRYEKAAIQELFGMLSGYKVKVAAGNHDTYLKDITDVDMESEILAGKFALLHGNRWPSEEAMQKDYIMTAHNHIAVSFRGDPYSKEKAWLISRINQRNAALKYKSFNRKARLVMFPAFNELIIGRAINEIRGKAEKEINPLLRNSLFDCSKGRVYTLKGEFVGVLGKIAHR